MSNATTASPAPSAPTNPTPNDDAARDLLASVAMYQTATPEQRTAVEQDMARCLADGLALEDYLTALADWPDAAEYLAECAEPAPGDDDSTASDEQAPVPTSTLAQANATLAKFGTACRDAADHNYRLGQLAWQYVEEFLGAAPGKAQRGTAVETLAEEWRKWDEDSMAVSVPVATKRLRERVNLLLRCHAVATLLGDGSGVAKGDGTRKGRGKGRKDGRLSWGLLRELCPLVYREESDHAETWHVLPSVAEQARSLVSEIAQSGMARQDVVACVAKLMLADAELELTAARESGDKARVKAAEDAVTRWGGKVERSQGKPEGEGKPAGAKGGKKTAKGKPTGIDSNTDTGTDNDADEADKGDDTPAPSGECRAKNLLTAPHAGTAKDVAEMALELISGCDEPDTVVAHLLALLAECGELSTPTRDAIRPVAFALADDDTPEDASEQRRRDAQAALASMKGPMIDDDAEAA